MSSVATTT